MLSLLLNLLRARQALLYASVTLLSSMPVNAKEKAPTRFAARPDEKGSVAQPEGSAEAAVLPAEKAPRRRSYFTVGLGSRFMLADTQGISDTRQFATDNILRPNEVIYRGSGVTLAEHGGAIALEPTLRAEWEIPAERYSWLSMLWSIEGGYSPAREVLSAAGSFRYQNAQAANVALTDLTYSGSLSVTERRFNLTPMFGFGAEYTNGWLKAFRQTHLLARFSLGAMFASGVRHYTLSLAPQYVTAVNDTYVIQSEITQSHTMAVLRPAARAEVGARARLSPRLHLALLVSVTAVYGNIAWQNQGYFAERAGATADKNIYQNIVSSSVEQTYMGIAPAIFLALSTEL
jgi:hypothetical protein